MRSVFDIGVSFVVRATSVLVLCAVVGMFVQMVFVAWPLTQSVKVTPLADAQNNIIASERTPDWVPHSDLLPAWRESIMGRVWLREDSDGAISGAISPSMDAAEQWVSLRFNAPEIPLSVLFIDSTQRWLVAVANDGRYRMASLRMDAVEWGNIERIKPFDYHAIGGANETLLFAAARSVRQYHLLKTAGSLYPELVLARTWQVSERILGLAAAPESQRVLILAGPQSIELWNATAQQRIAQKALAEPMEGIGWIDQHHFYAEAARNQQRRVWKVEGNTDAITLASLFTPVQYLGYPEPSQVWQTSSVGKGQEQKFGLTPLLFGSMKAALIAMLVALPCAVGAAFFVGFFMSNRARNRIKPIIELLEAIPTVVLAAVAAVWLAPIFLLVLPELFFATITAVLGIPVASALWRFAPASLHGSRYHGLLPLLLIPVILLLIAAGVLLGGYVEQQWMSGSLTVWLHEQFHVDLVHLNGLLVGIAMGIAVIPGIFSLAEDAVYSVPRHAAEGSLALGASRWRSFRDVILPLAWPGVISAVAIGAGRALGETMIVLMISGNTPILDWSPLTGMRTISATLAIELPETAFSSVHYQILFFAALLLFFITFLFNSLAEVLRLRMRKRFRVLAS
ncbi:ABC-type phosphate transporter, permease component [Luminiphilus syltensis NOR5-1B]|uniref:ABC-type phosphate transporter, permease component n=2 Tax=Luminiphilus TaxID=1341118 RepID=B8KRT4_9GAMM|nr:ABC-type phosphate transporter, permease component [Luminiphilus syltensis NOR5-1B]